MAPPKSRMSLRALWEKKEVGASSPGHSPSCWIVPNVLHDLDTRGQPRSVLGTCEPVPKAASSPHSLPALKAQNNTPKFTLRICPSLLFPQGKPDLPKTHPAFLSLGPSSTGTYQSRHTMEDGTPVLPPFPVDGAFSIGFMKGPSSSLPPP